MRAILLSVLLAGCLTEEECRRRSDDARQLAERQAPSCTYEPEALRAENCRGFDQRILRSYVGVWCSAAPLPCIEEDDELFDQCFGSPEPLVTN